MGRRMVAAVCATLACCAVGGGAGAAMAGQAPAGPPSTTVPFSLDHNRMIVEVELTRQDGPVRKARAWVDLGSQVLILAEPLARELGVDLPAGESQKTALSASPPHVRLGGMLLDMEGVALTVSPGAHVLAGVGVEVQLPASAFRHAHVVLDYPARSLTVARPNVLKPRGVAVPCRVSPETGLLMINAMLDGESVWLGVDNGSAGTWVSDRLTRVWQGRHADWPHVVGAAGSTNFFGFPFESGGTLMCLPEIGFGTLRARDVAVLGLDQSLFDWYSKKSAGPVLGFIGGNVLKGFRLEIDFPDQMTWWQPGPPVGERDLDIVPLTLHPDDGGGATVAGVVTRAGKPLVDGVQTGDTLVAVDGREVARARMGDVVDALRGAPGATRTLLLGRNGARSTVVATVMRLP